jgi:hypothetical protein
MAIVMVIDAQMTPQQYEEAFPELGLERNPAPGDLVHLAWANPSGGLRVVDVWESREAFEAFVRERLGPVLQRYNVPPPRIECLPLLNGYTPAGPLR